MFKLAIVHYMPLEFYPPATNFISYLDKAIEAKNVITKVYTSNNNKNRNVYRSEKSDIKRFNFPSVDEPRVVRMFKYLVFNIQTLFGLILQRPNAILYYETYSSYPVYLYARYFNKNVSICIHNHEYFTREWYRTNMKIVKYYHTLERKFLYNKAKWISQTNAQRIELFLSENPDIGKSKMQVLPNYPSIKWGKKNYKDEIDYPINIVYVGSLSLDDSYIREFCDYVISCKGKLKLDIYSFNLDSKTESYLSNLCSNHIRFKKKGIEYIELPKTLMQYDIGIILYKATTLNFKYNAPNKLFEYLACDLDVWYPDNMHGIEEYRVTSAYPKVLKLDFQNLDKLCLDELINRDKLKYVPSNFNYEEIYDKFLENIIIETGTKKQE